MRKNDETVMSNNNTLTLEKSTKLPGREGERDRPEERELQDIAGECHLIYERGMVLIFEHHFVTPEMGS